MFEASVFLTFLSTYLTASTIWWKQLSIVFDDLVSLGKLEQIFDPFVMILRWQKFFDFSLDFLPRIFVLTSWKKMETGIAWQIIFVTPNDVGDEQNKWLKLFDVDKESAAPAKEYFFVKLTFAELSFWRSRRGGDIFRYGV